MTRLFIEIYIAVLIAMGMVSGLMLWLMDARWPDDAHTRAGLLPAMQWMAQEIGSTQPGSASRAAALSELHRIAGPSIAILPMDVLALPAAERDRLAAGEVVFSGSRNARFVYIRLGREDAVLEWELYSRAKPLTQMLSVPIYVRLMQEASAPDRIHVERIPLDSLSDLTALERSRLLSRPITRLDGAWGMSTYQLTPGGTEVLRAFADTGPNVEPELVAPFTSMVLSALAIWLTVFPLYRRLLHLSRVAESLGRGNLAARAALKGRGPIQDLAHRFDRMAQRVESLIQSHEELLRAVAHELRHPISRLLFAAHLLRDAERPDKRQQLLGRIETAAADLSELTEELLTFSRLADGTPELVTEATTPNAVVEAIQMRMDDPRICFQVQAAGDYPVMWHAQYVVRALGNLVANACQYARERILVRCQMADGRVWFWVEDDGPGVPSEHRAQIFAPFRRVEHSRTREGGGAGLGLAIVQRIVTKHGGSVHLGDSELGGAKFGLELPAVAGTRAS